MLVRLGCHTAINLDGGGSTSLVSGGRLRNKSRTRDVERTPEPGGRRASRRVAVPAALAGSSISSNCSACSWSTCSVVCGCRSGRRAAPASSRRMRWQSSPRRHEHVGRERREVGGHLPDVEVVDLDDAGMAASARPIASGSMPRGRAPRAGRGRSRAAGARRCAASARDEQRRDRVGAVRGRRQRRARRRAPRRANA